MILVTGGTGLVGSHLLFSLLKDDKKIRAIYRTPESFLHIKKVFAHYNTDFEENFNKIEWVQANINDVSTLSKVFEGITHVFHCAAYIDFDPKNYAKLKKINIDGTANIVNLCILNRIKKLCYVSSVSAIGKNENEELINEETSWNPENENSVYAISKFGAEMEVWRGSQEGLDVVIVNPGIIIGETDRDSGSGKIITSVSKGIPFYTSGGFGIVDVKDVVNAMTSLMESPIKNQRFLLIGKNILYKDFFEALSLHFNLNPPKMLAPKWVLSGIQKLDWISAKIFGTRRRLLKEYVNSMYRISVYDASKIEKHLSFKYTPHEETIRRVVKNYMANS